MYYCKVRYFVLLEYIKTIWTAYVKKNKKKSRYSYCNLLYITESWPVAIYLRVWRRSILLICSDGKEKQQPHMYDKQQESYTFPSVYRNDNLKRECDGLN